MLLDTDVLIDVALERRPHSELASEILDRLEYGRQNAFIAWHTVSNFYYLVAPSRGGMSARDFIVELTRFVAVASTGTESGSLRSVASNDGLRGRHAGGCRTRLRCPVHCHQEREGLRTLADPCHQSPRGAQ